MADVTAIGAIPAPNSNTNLSTSLGAYQRWLSGHGLMPIDQVLRRHPSEVATELVGEARGLSTQWDKFLHRTADRFATDKIERIMAGFDAAKAAHLPGAPVGTAHPGPARAPLGAAAGGATSLDVASSRAASMIAKAGAAAVEAQWQQTVSMVEHDLSMQVLSTTIKASISTAKEFQDNLNTLMRG